MNKKGLEKLNDIVRNYNGQMALWKRYKYEGALPLPLLKALGELKEETEKVFNKLLANE